MAELKPNIIQRLLFGPNVNKGIEKVEEKGNFPVDRYNELQWTNTSLLNTRGYYGGSIDYRTMAGDLIDSSVVMSCLNWLMRVFPRARCRVVLETEDGLEPVKGHALSKLLKRPNPVYSGTQLWRLTVLSYNWNGNAYWRKVRNAQKQVIQLWYEPHWTIRPRRTSADEFVSFYELYRDNKWVRVEVEDVVHFRWVLSPENQMLSMGPIDSGLREIFSDNEAARFTASVFANYGTFSRLISPKEGDAPLSQAELIRLIAELQTQTTGDNRFKAVGATVPMDIYEGQTDMSKLEMRTNRMTPEERICSLIGLKPAVTGLGSGSLASTYNNTQEAARDAYDNNILPAYDSFAEELDIQLVPDFTQIEDETVEFDTSKIAVLKGDLEKREASVTTMYTASLITRAQGKVMLGLKPADDGSDDVYRLSPLLEVALLNQGRVSPDVLEAVTEDGELLPDPTEAPTDAVEGNGDKANGNGHLFDYARDGRFTPSHITELFIPNGKAKKPTVDSVMGDIMAAVQSEIEDVYSETAEKI